MQSWKESKQKKGGKKEEKNDEDDDQEARGGKINSFEHLPPHPAIHLWPQLFISSSSLPRRHSFDETLLPCAQLSRSLCIVDGTGALLLTQQCV